MKMIVVCPHRSVGSRRRCCARQRFDAKSFWHRLTAPASTDVQGRGGILRGPAVVAQKSRVQIPISRREVRDVAQNFYA